MMISGRVNKLTSALDDARVFSKLDVFATTTFYVVSTNSVGTLLRLRIYRVVVSPIPSRDALVFRYFKRD